MYDVDEIGGVVAVVIAGLVVAGIGMVAYVIYYYVFRGLCASTSSVMATVIRKHQHEGGIGLGGSYGGGSPLGGGIDPDIPSYNYFLTFDAGGRRLDFSVPERVYADVSEGDSGLLVHKGTLFRQFLKDAGIHVKTGRAQIRKV